MDLTKLSKKELLAKCEENEIIKCKSKTKKELISLLQNKLNEPSINIDATNIEIEKISNEIGVLVVQVLTNAFTN
jgi:hypothetical protein